MIAAESQTNRAPSRSSTRMARRSRPQFPDPRSVVALAALLIPVAFIVWMGWRHRWTSDDAFVDLRIVRQIRAGHGPVYNVAERVEAGTSPLWIGILAMLDLLTPIRLEWIALLAALAATGSGVALAVFGTRRVFVAMGSPGGILLPLGALVYVALPPSWDFATSGLENGLCVLWLGVSWYVLAGRVREPGSDPSRPWWIPVVLGLGPLVRPDFAIFSALFLLSLILLGQRNVRSVARAIAIALLLPLVAELFRMAYYGSVVPNTAVTKEASLSYWSHGWLYFKDLVSPYWLAVPILLLAAALVTAMVRRAPSDRDRPTRFAVLAAITIAAGLLHAVYVVRVGGDFMHGRMLLPSLFVVLLPVSVVAVRGLLWLVAVGVILWSLVCAASLSTPYSGGVSTRPFSFVPVDRSTGIADERLVYVRYSGNAHPVTIDDFQHAGWAQAGARTRTLARAGKRGLLLDPGENAGQQLLLPLRKGVRAPIVALVGATGMFGYAAGTDVAVEDRFGLADPLAAHLKLGIRDLPGHEKRLEQEWMVARFAAPKVQLPPTVDKERVAAARRALACGQLPELLASTTEPLGAGRITDNILDSFTLWRSRFPPTPAAAESRLCGEHRR